MAFIFCMRKFDIFETIPEGFRLARKEDLSLVTLTFAQAFADYKYPVPSTEAPYSALLRYNYELAKLCSLNAIENGVVLTNEDFSAVIQVVPFEMRAQYDIDSLYKILKENASKEAAENMLQIFDYITEGEKLLNIEESTVFVDMFAVQTPRQGQKLGSMLMRELQRQCKEKNWDILLYTNTDRNNSIYNHFGFDTINKIHKEELNSTTYYLLWRANN